MINGKKVLALVTARSGSKGLPGKNLRVAAGKPLIAWSIDAAKKSKYIDRVVLSSDDKEIIDVARQYDCDVPFVRPDELASDTASSYDVAIHALASIDEKFDILVLLQPTSPMRIAEDIDICLEFSLEHGSSISLVEVDKSPYWMYKISPSGGMAPLLVRPEQILRRQDSPPVYVLNGAVYAVDCDWLKQNGSFVDENTVPYIMPKERSLDIDTIDDFAYFELLLNKTILNKTPD